MGHFSKRIGTSGGSGSSKAHHVGISPQEDRGSAAEKVGEVAGGAEEGGLRTGEPAARLRQALLSQQILHNAEPFLIK
jgi:hypothetical protein